MNLYDRIPNNVNLSEDKKLQRALEKWLPNYLDWWREMGPEGFQDKDVWLRTAIDVGSEGWAHFDYVKMPEYRWGIFLEPAQPDAKVGFGDNYGQPAYQEVPGEFRNALRRIIVTQGDTEPASVEQQRRLGHTCPSLYDLRNLFQVNVEEGRHLWAMVYLLQRYFGRDGRDEADALLERRSGNPDKPRILEAFNQPCDDWLNFFCFTMFTDRDGKYQLSALAESGFEPLARTCQFMLTEEAHHLFVGETGVGRVVEREVPMRNALNEVLRGEYVRDCERALERWNKYIADEGVSYELRLPHRRFHRHVGEYAGHHFDIDGNLISAEEFEARKSEWLPTQEDREYVQSLMHPVTEPGKIANWIAPPATGIKGKPFEFEYVRL